MSVGAARLSAVFASVARLSAMSAGAARLATGSDGRWIFMNGRRGMPCPIRLVSALITHSFPLFSPDSVASILLSTCRRCPKCCCWLNLQRFALTVRGVHGSCRSSDSCAEQPRRRVRRCGTNKRHVRRCGMTKRHVRSCDTTRSDSFCWDFVGPFRGRSAAPRSLRRRLRSSTSWNLVQSYDLPLV
jgi:hypothetical protein